MDANEAVLLHFVLLTLTRPFDVQAGPVTF
jgi:hypothetical protein